MARFLHLYVDFLRKYAWVVIVIWLAASITSAFFVMKFIEVTTVAFSPPPGTAVYLANEERADHFPFDKQGQQAQLSLFVEVAANVLSIDLESNNNNNTITPACKKTINPTNIPKSVVDIPSVAFFAEAMSFAAELLGSSDGWAANVGNYYLLEAIGAGNVSSQLVSADQRILLLPILLPVQFASNKARSFGTQIMDERARLEQAILLNSTFYNMHKYDNDTDYVECLGRQLTSGGTGVPIMETAMIEQSKKDLARMDAIVIPIALLVIAYTIKSLRLLILPILSIGLSLALSFALCYPIGLNVKIVSACPSLMMSLCIAMGIDYNLFILSRFVEEVRAGQRGTAAVLNTLATAGHTVLVSGISLTISFMAIIFFPTEFLRSFGYGCSLSLVVALLVSLNLTPTLLIQFFHVFEGAAYPVALPDCLPQWRIFVRFGFYLQNDDDNDGNSPSSMKRGKQQNDGNLLDGGNNYGGTRDSQIITTGSDYIFETPGGAHHHHHQQQQNNNNNNKSNNPNRSSSPVPTLEALDDGYQNNVSGSLSSSKNGGVLGATSKSNSHHHQSQNTSSNALGETENNNNNSNLDNNNNLSGSAPNSFPLNSHLGKNVNKTPQSSNPNLVNPANIASNNTTPNKKNSSGLGNHNNNNSNAAVIRNNNRANNNNNMKQNYSIPDIDPALNPVPSLPVMTESTPVLSQKYVARERKAQYGDEIGSSVFFRLAPILRTPWNIVTVVLLTALVGYVGSFTLDLKLTDEMSSFLSRGGSQRDDFMKIKKHFGEGSVFPYQFVFILKQDFDGKNNSSNNNSTKSDLVPPPPLPPAVPSSSSSNSSFPQNPASIIGMPEYFDYVHFVLSHLSNVTNTPLAQFTGAFTVGGNLISFDQVQACVKATQPKKLSSSSSMDPPAPASQNSSGAPSSCDPNVFAMLNNMTLSPDGKAAIITFISNDIDPTGNQGKAFYHLLLDAIQVQYYSGDSNNSSAAAVLMNDFISVYLCGVGPMSIDTIETTYQHFPLIGILSCVAVSVMVGIAFRSIVVPLRCIVSIAFTEAFVFGMTVLVYQKGILDWLHAPAVSGVGAVSWLTPIVAFCVIIGVSLDYDLFLLTRISEFITKEGVSTAEGTLLGLCATGGIITAAGFTMAIAFFGLVLTDMRLINELGFMLVVAVLFDTFIIRTLLVPAFMSLLGKYHWWPTNLESFAFSHIFGPSDSISARGSHYLSRSGSDVGVAANGMMIGDGGGVAYGQGYHHHQPQYQYLGSGRNNNNNNNDETTTGGGGNYLNSSNRQSGNPASCSNGGGSNDRNNKYLQQQQQRLQHLFGGGATI